MPERRIISIEHHQTLTAAADRPGWSEKAEVSVRLFGDAVRSGWLAQFTGHHGNDLPVLLAIAMHARPLIGEDLDLLLRLSLAGKQDEGRLYARVTDEGLADELDIKRDTVDASTRRLQSKSLLTILHLPGSTVFRDSRGHYGGTKLYLLSGDLSGRLVKEVVPTAPKNNLIHGAQNLGTVPGAAMPESWAQSAQVLGTNIDSVVDVVVDPAATARAYFLNRKEPGYFFNPKDDRELARLFAEGYSLDQICQGIDLAFGLPSKPRQFVQCARVTRQRLPAAGIPDSHVPDIRHGGLQTSDTLATPAIEPESPDQLPGTTENPALPSLQLGWFAGHEKTYLVESTELELGLEAQLPGPPEVIVLSGMEGEFVSQAESMPAELGPAAAMLASILGSRPDNRDLARLWHLAALCDHAAKQAGSDGPRWLLDALALTLTADGVKSPVRYTETILRWWLKHGKGADLRPGRSGYQPIRMASKGLAAGQAAGNIGADVNHASGAGTEVINGKPMTKTEAGAYYDEIRKQREARRLRTSTASRKGD